MQQNILFIDRDGTLIIEPEDKQIDQFDKLEFFPQVIPALLKLTQHGYRFVMVSNQDGLGTNSFPKMHFQPVHDLIIKIFASQGIQFDDVLICPHFADEGCQCRKPKTGLLQNYITNQAFNREKSFVIGDRDTDLELAKNLGVTGIKIGESETRNWFEISEFILNGARKAIVKRNTNETTITAELNLNLETPINIKTGIGFFDHMLEQLAKHAGCSLQLNVDGDLHIDDHHTIEDTAIVLGSAFKKVLNNKFGIARYGFVLPMDEALCTVAIDLSGRASFNFNAQFSREKVGDMATELVKHFFLSFTQSLEASIHIDVKGENCHHMIEAIFKSMGRCLKQAIRQTDNNLPSTKGIL